MGEPEIVNDPATDIVVDEAVNVPPVSENDELIVKVCAAASNVPPACEKVVLVVRDLASVIVPV